MVLADIAEHGQNGIRTLQFCGKRFDANGQPLNSIGIAAIFGNIAPLFSSLKLAENHREITFHALSLNLVHRLHLPQSM